MTEAERDLSRATHVAFAIAYRAHEGALYNGLSYIVHPVDVAIRVAAEGGDDLNVLVPAALLHDVVEDTSVTLGDIEFALGPEVAEVVDGVTRRGHETYHEFILRAAENPRTARVKRADLEANLSRLPARKEGLRPRYEAALETLAGEGSTDGS